MNTLRFLSVPHFPSAIVVHSSHGFPLSEQEKQQIFSADYGRYSVVFFSLKGFSEIPSECIEMMLELRRMLKYERKSLFFVEGSVGVFEVLQSVGISPLECFESLAEAVMSVGA